MSPLDLALVFGAGLLGSVHCVGMCGGLVGLLTLGAPADARGRQARYFAGKTATYAALGALAGAAGEAAGLVAYGVEGVLSVALGLVLVGAGLAVCGVAWRRRGAAGAPARATAWLGPVVGRVVGSPSPWAPVGLGLVNGLLPCGLVYGLLAKAASTGSATAGAATMAVFGLATVPALALVGVAGTRLAPAWRARLQRGAGVVIVVLGLLTLARGAVALDALGAGGPAATDLHCIPTPASVAPASVAPAGAASAGAAP